MAYTWLAISVSRTQIGRRDARATMLIRIRPELKLQLAQKAQASRRSLNAEVCVALERYLREGADQMAWTRSL